MSKTKQEEKEMACGIAKRAFRTIAKNFESIEAGANALGVTKATVYHWANGRNAPSAVILAKMDRRGFDVKWILTGRCKA